MARYLEDDDYVLEDELRYGLRYQEDLHQNEKGLAAAGDSKSASKKGTPSTRGTAISFGFRRRTPATTGIPVPVANNNKYYQEQHQRSKSVGPEHESRRRQVNDDDYCYQPSSRYHNYSNSGRSTPRLAPPKKEASGQPLRTNRFGFRNQPVRFTDKVADLTTYNSHTTLRDISLDRGSPQQHHFRNVHHAYNHQPHELDTYSSSPFRRPSRSHQPRPSPVNQPMYHHNNSNNNNGSMDTNRSAKYGAQSSQLPVPQFSTRVPESSSKIAKTMANQNRKVSSSGRVMATGHYYNSKDGSGTEDSGIGSHGGCSDENGGSSNGRSRYDYYSRPRKLGVVLNGKSFDVRDVDEEQHTVTEISVIQLPQNFAQQQLRQVSGSPNLNQSTGLVRERMSQYQRLLLSKDNRYMDSSSTTSVSTTSSEGYGEGLDEEKVFHDRARTEKLPVSSSSSMMRSTDFSVASSADEQEYGHAGGEAMADEYCFSSSEDFHGGQAALAEPEPLVVPSSIINQSTRQHFRAISNAAKNGTLANSTLRSVLLTIEDPAFAAVAATTTTLIDDETSPVDSLFDSPTASVESDHKLTKKEANVMERSGDTLENCESPGTPTNASNSLSLSEGREFFDDEIADQPGLVFDEGLDGSIGNTDHSQTVQETMPKLTSLQDRSVENSPIRGRKMNRAGSVSTLSSCESLASDDLMMDFERSDASSFGDVNSRGNSQLIMQDLEDATSLLELEIQGQEVMREWNSLLGQSQQALNNSANNNINTNLNNNSESGESKEETGSFYQLTFPE